MGRANYKAPLQASWLKICYGVRIAALVAEPYPSRRGDHPWHRPPRHTTLLAAFNPGQHKEVWQGVGHGNRQKQQKQAQAGNITRFLWWRKRAGRGRRRQKRRQHRRKGYFKRHYKLRQQEREKYLMGQCPCASSSNGCRRQCRQHRFPVHGPWHEQPGKTCWQGHCWRSNQQRRQESTKPLHQDQAHGQRVGGQEEMLFWNMKKHCWVTASYLPAAMLQQASMYLRPMNMAGFCLPGMRVPHNTSQYIMDQHEFPWKNEEEAVAAMFGGSNYRTEGEDFLLTDQEDEGIYTEEEEEESTQPAWQD